MYSIHIIVYYNIIYLMNSIYSVINTGVLYSQRVWVLRNAYQFFHELQSKYARLGKS